jgi:hypothetical protein
VARKLLTLASIFDNENAAKWQRERITEMPSVDVYSLTGILCAIVAVVGGGIFVKFVLAVHAAEF